ncbi:MAG: universal stress protein [Solirubrobacteraceae bacterium]
MFKRIVVGYASDEAGRDALRLTAKLAALLASEVTIVYPYSPLLCSVPADAAEERIREKVRAAVPDSEGLAQATYHWSSSPWPIHALHSMASYEDAELIVIGAAREGIAGHLHISLIERMVHGAPCAVAVAPAGYAEGEPPNPRRIGVGFADTDEGKAALRLGAEIAERLDGELEVIAGSGLGASLTAYAFASALLPEVEDELYAETKAKLEQAIAELAQSVPVQMNVKRGEPSRLLAECSEHMDLLLLGSRAYGPLRHVLLGSVSATVIRESRCPVLVIPRGTVDKADSALGEAEADVTLGT